MEGTKGLRSRKTRTRERNDQTKRKKDSDGEEDLKKGLKKTRTEGGTREADEPRRLKQGGVPVVVGRRRCRG